MRLLKHLGLLYAKYPNNYHYLILSESFEGGKPQQMMMEES